MTDDKSNVITLRDGPTVNDVPGMLRKLAAAIEAGDVETDTVLVVIPDPGDYPDVYCYGEHPGDYAAYTWLDLAKQVVLENHLKGD